MPSSPTPSADPLTGFRDGLNRHFDGIQPIASQPQAPVTQAPPAAVPPAAPATPAPLQGEEKRAADARSAQSAMSRERNSLEAVLRQASDLRSTLESLTNRTAGIKGSLDKVKPLSFSPVVAFDPAVKEEHPWLAQTIDHIHATLAVFSQSFNALLVAMGGYAESVDLDRKEYAERNTGSLLLQLDASYPLWRVTLTPETPENQRFDAWLDTVPGHRFNEYRAALEDCQSFADVAEVFDAYETAFPGALRAQAHPHAAAPGGMETSPIPSNGAGALTTTPGGVVPLTDEEARNYPTLYARAATDADRALLELRQSAYTRASIQRMIDGPRR